MKTLATSGYNAKKVSQPSPQLKVRVELLQSMEVREVIEALNHPGIRLIYDEKSCRCRFDTLKQPDASCLKTLEGSINLEEGSLHYGQFASRNTFEVRKDGELLGMATVMEVLDPDFSYWDWEDRPEGCQHYALPFTSDQLECFLLHLEFDLLELPFLRDYIIQKARNDDYAIDIRIMTRSGAVDHQQALMMVETLKRQPGDYCCIKPGFYQLADSRQLENFECHFIFGSGNRSVAGRLIVL